MGAASERRALLNESNDDYDPCLFVDINEYLIEEWETLTYKQRQSVWHLCQNDEDFDYSSIHDQIDAKVYEFSETNPEVDLGNTKDPVEVDESDEEVDDLIYDMMCNYLAVYWPALTGEQLDSISNSLVVKQVLLFDFLDLFLIEYANESDSSIDLSELETQEETA